MLKIEKKLDTDPDLAWELLAPRERIVFLDIETTGFRASSSCLYLIGTAEYVCGTWKLHQYFAERKADELLLIHALSSFFREKKKEQDHLILVTYNGDGFDIPYLREVENEYGETGLFRDIVSFDLYKKIKPIKKMACLENLQLKTVEKKCGICREDIYSGSDLISVYEEYVRLAGSGTQCGITAECNESCRKKYLDCLLLHNEEDIADLIPTMQMMGYRYLHEGYFDFENAEIKEIRGGKILSLRFRLKERLPSELFSEDEHTVLSVSGEDPYLMEITVGIEAGVMRYYYPDHKEYYYLPAEDMAVHRSVAGFTDPKNRIRATASNCYTKEEGEFFAVPSGTAGLAPLFYRSYKGTPYAKFTEKLLAEGAFWKEYALAVLNR